MANIPEIHLAPEAIAQVGPLIITNTMITTLFSTVIIILFGLYIRRGAGVRPTRLQVVFESMMEFMNEKIELAFGDNERAKKFFPLVFTIFIFLLFVNQFSLLPFVESIFIGPDQTPLFRTPTSDYSLPIALAILTLALSHILALMISPIRHVGNFLKFDVFFKIKSLKELPMAFLEFFLGLLDIIGEVAKLISLSTRLFGNIFAGGVIIAIISGLSVYTKYLIPIPFLVLSTLSGLVQAFVFAMLTILFISSTTNAVIKSK